MAYVIYEKSSTMIMGKPDRNGVTRPDHRKSYKTLGAAEAALTRICKAEGLLQTDPNYGRYRYAIAARAYFHQNIEKKVAKRNMMTGKEYSESVNTPVHMSPSSETYWSM